MAYTGALLQIQNTTSGAVTYNGVSYAIGSYVPLSRLVTYQVGYQKLWGSKSGRNAMTGEMKGTLVGVFTKLSINIGNENGANMMALVKLFNTAQAYVKYYDIAQQAQITELFYFGDVVPKLLSQSADRHTVENVDIVAVRRRG